MLIRVVYIIIFYNIVYKLYFKCSIPCCLTTGSMDKLDRGSNPGSKTGRLTKSFLWNPRLFTHVPRNLYESSCPVWGDKPRLALSSQIKQKYQNGNFHRKLTVPTFEGSVLFSVPVLNLGQLIPYNFTILSGKLPRNLKSKFKGLPLLYALGPISKCEGP